MMTSPHGSDHTIAVTSLSSFVVNIMSIIMRVKLYMDTYEMASYAMLQSGTFLIVQREVQCIQHPRKYSV